MCGRPLNAKGLADGSFATTLWVELAVSATEYGSVAMDVRWWCVTTKRYRLPSHVDGPLTLHTPVSSLRRMPIREPSSSSCTERAVGAHSESETRPRSNTGP